MQACAQLKAEMRYQVGSGGHNKESNKMGSGSDQ